MTDNSRLPTKRRRPGARPSGIAVAWPRLVGLLLVGSLIVSACSEPRPDRDAAQLVDPLGLPTSTSVPTAAPVPPEPNASPTPDPTPTPAPQRLTGASWRILEEFDFREHSRLSAAVDEQQYRELRNALDLEARTLPDVDFSQEVVLRVTAGHASQGDSTGPCGVRFIGLELQHPNDLIALIETPGSPDDEALLCASTLFGAVTWLVAVERAALPEEPFSFSLGERCASCDRTSVIVEPDLRLPARPPDPAIAACPVPTGLDLPTGQPFDAASEIRAARLGGSPDWIDDLDQMGRRSSPLLRWARSLRNDYGGAWSDPTADDTIVMLFRSDGPTRQREAEEFVGDAMTVVVRPAVRDLEFLEETQERVWLALGIGLTSEAEDGPIVRHEFLGVAIDPVLGLIEVTVDNDGDRLITGLQSTLGDAPVCVTDLSKLVTPD